MGLTELEQSVLDAHRRGGHLPGEGLDPGAPDSWLRFSLGVALEAGRRVRGWRIAGTEEDVVFKSDGTPATALEHDIETYLRDALAKFCPSATLVGEETGGHLPQRGLSVAVDPVDGTWALLNRTETCATAITVFQDGEPTSGIVSNPVSGEIGYVGCAARTRLLQLELFGQAADGCDLPLPRLTPAAELVNIHPQRNAGYLVQAFFEAWNARGVRSVRAAGGSPAFAMFDAAKGGFTYVNLWEGRATRAYDLTSGVLLIRGAGGEVVDLQDRPIDPLRHHGPFVAGIDPENRRRAREITRDALREH